MHFYSHLIQVLFPFVILGNNDDVPPVGDAYVVNYLHQQVVTYNGSILIAKEP